MGVRKKKVVRIKMEMGMKVKMRIKTRMTRMMRSRQSCYWPEAGASHGGQHMYIPLDDCMSMAEIYS